jgi:porphobilinogen synthase
VILFGIPAHKDPLGTQAYADTGIVQEAVRRLKKRFPQLVVITDVCMCEFTSHGHCGILEDNYVQNDVTLKYLAKTALSHARAGADMVAPSDMMDGRIQAIRQALDEAGFKELPIMSYAVKSASSFYGPFRDAAESAPAFGDRKSYQMDPANLRQAMCEAEADIEEGADIIMVKPALPYLDVLRRIRDGYNVPTAAYQVSGEYSMIKAGAQLGWIDEQSIVMESLTSMKRAGADLILTYFAQDVLSWLA